MKKLLFVSFCYPPLLGPGSIRPSKFEKYLSDYGWHVDILTVDAPHFPATEVANVYRASCEPFLGKVIDLPVASSLENKPVRDKRGSVRNRLLRLVGWNGFSSFHFPDVESGWKKNALIKGRELIAQNNYSAIVSSFPPVTSHVLASTLSRESGLPWVADYRDEWSSERYFSPRKGLWKILDTYIEKKTLANATHVVTVSEPIANALRKLHGKPVSVIYNGFDNDDYDEVKRQVGDGKLRLVFTGTLSEKNNMTILFQATRELLAEGHISPENIELHFIGNQHSGFRNEVSEIGLEQLVKITGWVSYQESLCCQLAATALFFPFWEAEGAEGVLSSKIFTYIGSRKPILFLGSSSHIISEILEKTGQGFTVEDKERCKELLVSWIANSTERRGIHIVPNEVEILKYSRRVQAGQLASILNEEIARNPCR